MDEHDAKMKINKEISQLHEVKKQKLETETTKNDNFMVDSLDHFKFNIFQPIIQEVIEKVEQIEQEENLTKNLNEPAASRAQ